MIIDHTHPEYIKAWNSIGKSKWNGAYYYSIEIVENIMKICSKNGIKGQEKNYALKNIAGYLKTMSEICDINNFKKLNPKEKMIISKRFFDGRTQMEVAEEIGISQAQVSRLEKSALNHIKRIYR